ncbi:cyclopropane fatty acyl phospholipid synthase [Pontibacter cellulosilyticus]|uniref:Cyclopropane fatty acyl phospholipid synthase n=1 Tax=Pontibacter cellulosilyticus TaxID=1720253 RepID=A0A923N7P0_9BACT|nr:cyclopropane fatty acyl phospholipid synthase [Pontibacter cellulosilyticus]MBC5993709.1 cyclopropane fatty acyl phospholipid synthase [Pontibacter cellulosilyticus]
MAAQSLQQQVVNTLATADVKINGPDPWDLQVHDKRFYKRILTDGTLGLGESYMDGWWDCQSIDQFVFKVLRADLYKKANLGWRSVLQVLLAKLLNMQAKGKAARNAQRHYDIGNKLYELMLDRRMTYSCGYWKGADNLDQAQENKLDLICRKLYLRPGQRVLDIGCGWGSFAGLAAEKYGAEVVGITVSKEQAALARERYKGLPVEIRLQDYRDINEQFDHVVSVGMFEHVGYRNHRKFMQVAARCLKDDGLFLLHTIGHNYSRTSADPFTDTYIFPNCLIPSVKQLGAAMEHIFKVEDWHNFGPYYDNTLMAWFDNFNRNWDQLQGEYGERFYRMWKYYLLSSAGSFRARNNQLWQLVLSKEGIAGGYTAVR